MAIENDVRWTCGKLLEECPSHATVGAYLGTVLILNRSAEHRAATLDWVNYALHLDEWQPTASEVAIGLSDVLGFTMITDDEGQPTGARDDAPTNWVALHRQ